MASGAPYDEAAKAAGVSSKTVYRRNKDQVFRERVEQLKQERARQITGGLLGLGVSAISQLAQLLESDDERIRVQAVKLVLDQNRHYRDREIIEEIAIRLKQVELEVQRRFGS